MLRALRTLVTCGAIALALAACDGDVTIDPSGSEIAAPSVEPSSESTPEPSSEPVETPSPSAPTSEPATSEPPASESESEPEPVGDQTVVLEPDGVGIVTDEDSIIHFTFGQADYATTAQALESQLGPAAAEEDLTECGAGPLHSVSWPGLATYFQDDTLEGWYIQDEGTEVFTTLYGIGLGSTRADLEEAFSDLTVEESSIGTEWSGGGMAGVLTEDSPTGTVEVMWAGLNCIAR